MKVTLLGSPTLERFTVGILRNGFEACGYKVVSNYADSDVGIIQIHGAPAARKADLEIIENLPKISACLAACIILLYRPDEIRDTVPQLKSVLSALPVTNGLVMLGDLLIDDPFYQFPRLPRRVVPHGFFDINTEVLSHPIIVGSHTTWGEMRSIQRTLVLLKAISDRQPGAPVIGYLGGGPAEALSRESISINLQQLNLTNVFTLRDLNVEHWRDEILGAGPNTIFLHSGSAPSDFDVTFNVQLYHYGNRIRLGESSGSLHTSAGIPVIFEMNGSERIENLRTVKVPYLNPSDADTADLKFAAQQIVALISSGEYRQMLTHNRHMAAKWNNQGVVRLYIEFLEFLAKEGITKGSSRAQSAATS